MMQKILGGTFGVCALIFLDDVIVFSKTYAEHLQHVERVLAAMDEAGLTVSLEKSRFGATKMRYLVQRWCETFEGQGGGVVQVVTSHVKRDAEEMVRNSAVLWWVYKK